MDLQVPCVVGGGEVVIPNAERVAEGFFALDPSSRAPASFDAHALTCTANRIDRRDLDALNGPMRARSPEGCWQELFDAGDLPFLQALPRDWDLVLMSEHEWDRQGVEALIEAAFAGMFGTGRQVSVVSKMLHLKRPRLIPVLDSLVLEQLRRPITTAPTLRVGQTMEVIGHLRDERERLRPELEPIQAHLGGRGIERPLVRILDALLWTSHQASLTYPLIELIAGWGADDASTDRGY